jgi:hypothetical protein
MTKKIVQKKEANTLKSRFWLFPNSLARLLVETAHMILAIYTAFALPLLVSFGLEFKGVFFVMEIVCFVEGVVYSFLQLRIADYQ